ncbi:hypothetical protein [Streptomyces sp. NPDC058735]|uniref:hypothetical protein n=1 Tax=unclassified Streptomyces TaxID=2593676 RepID=UPI0036C08326
MKSTTRGTLAAVMTCVAAATHAAAVGTVPDPVPPGGADEALDVELPQAAGELPVPLPGSPEEPRYVEGRMIPEGAVPQRPVHGGLPGVDERAPLPHPLGSGFDHVGVDAPASGLRTLAPGVSVDAPLTAPDADGFGMPRAKLPQAGVPTPAVRTVPAADLGVGPGLQAAGGHLIVPGVLVWPSWW